MKKNLDSNKVHSLVNNPMEIMNYVTYTFTLFEQ